MRLSSEVGNTSKSNPFHHFHLTYSGGFSTMIEEQKYTIGKIGNSLFAHRENYKRPY